MEWTVTHARTHTILDMDMPVKMRVLGFILHDLLGDLLFMTIANCGPNNPQTTESQGPLWEAPWMHYIQLNNTQSLALITVPIAWKGGDIQRIDVSPNCLEQT